MGASVLQSNGKYYWYPFAEWVNGKVKYYSTKDYNTRNDPASVTKNSPVSRVRGYAENYLVYPCSTIGISQGYNGSGHKYHHTGSPKDYPWDETGGSGNRIPMYCPCDEMVVKRIYINGTNTIWLESTTPVVFAGNNIENDYVTMLVTHPWYHDDLRNLYVGKTFKRGEVICYSGSDGNSTGNHFHFAAGTGTIKKGNTDSLGWNYNSNKKWVLACTGKMKKPEELFFIDTVNNQHSPTSSNGITFKQLTAAQAIVYEPGTSGTAGSSGGVSQTPTKLWGIDVANPNGKIDYQLVKDAGVDFAIIRAGWTGWGTHYDNGTLKPYDVRVHKDDNFENNYTGFKEVGIPIGAYYFSCATTQSQAEIEANKMIEVLNGREFEYPIFIDMEDKHNQLNAGADKLAKVVITFCEKLKKAGYEKVGLYSSTSWLEESSYQQIDDSQLTDYIHWLADWTGHTPNYTGKYTIHQYSNMGVVNGVPRPRWPKEGTDVNWSYYDYANDTPVTSSTAQYYSRRKRTEFSETLLQKEIEAKFDFNNATMFFITKGLSLEDQEAPSWWYENNKGERAWMGSCIEVFALKIKKHEKVKIYYSAPEDLTFIEDFLKLVDIAINGAPDSSQPNVPEEAPETTTTT